MEPNDAEMEVADGLFMQREETGFVRVRVRDTIVATIAPSPWAQAVAKVSRIGVTDARHSQALTFHMDHGPAESHDEMLARLAYAAYGASTNWLNYAGKQMPHWHDLPDAIKRAWMASSAAIEKLVRGE